MKTIAWIAGLAVLAGPALAVAGGDAFEAGRYQGNMAALMRTVLSRN